MSIINFAFCVVLVYGVIASIIRLDKNYSKREIELMNRAEFGFAAILIIGAVIFSVLSN